MGVLSMLYCIIMGSTEIKKEEGEKKIMEVGGGGRDTTENIGEDEITSEKWQPQKLRTI